MNLLESLMLISIVTTLSRTLGFIRDIIVARIFGASIMTDSFFISFKLTNLIRKIFIDGAFFQTFMPLLVEYKNRNEFEFIKEFISYSIGFIITIISVISILGIIFAPNILNILVPGFVDTKFKFDLTTKLLRIIFPYILISTLSSISSSILNTWNEFIVPSLSMSFVNVTMIFFAIFSSLFNPPILALAWSILIGNLFQFIYQLKYLKNIDMIIYPNFNLNNKNVFIIINRMWPILLSELINQISIIGNTIFTSFLSSGSVSWMYYADRIIELPSGILGSTLNTILFPSLSKSVTNKNKEEYSRSLDWGLRLCMILSIPITFILIILSKPIIFSIFKYGKFSYFDACMTHESLIAYSLGLVGIILVKILTPSFYSYQDTKTPLKISIFTFLITQFLNFFLISKFKHIGLSLSIGLSACLNSILLYYFLIKKKLFVPQPGWGIFITKIFISIIIMSISLIISLNFVSDWKIGSMLYRLIKLFIIILIGSTTYFLSLLLMGLKLKDFYYSVN